MIRALNLVANFSVNTAQWKAGLQQIESSANQVAAKIGSLEASVDSYMGKSRRMADELENLSRNRGQMLLDYDLQISRAIAEKTKRANDQIQRNKELEDSLNKRLKLIQSGIEATEKFDNKIRDIWAKTDDASLKKELETRKLRAMQEYDLITDELKKKEDVFKREAALRRKYLDKEIEDLKEAIQKQQQIIAAKNQSVSLHLSSSKSNINAAQTVRDARIAEIRGNSALKDDEKTLAIARANRQYRNLVTQLERPAYREMEEANKATERANLLQAKIEASRQELARLHSPTMAWSAADQKKQQKAEQLASFVDNYSVNDFRRDEINRIRPQYQKLVEGRDNALAAYRQKKQGEIDKIANQLASLPADSEIAEKLNNDIEKLRKAYDTYEKRLDARISKLHDEIEANDRVVAARQAEIEPRRIAAKSALQSDYIRTLANRYENYDYTASRIQGVTLGMGAAFLGSAKFGADLNTSILQQQHNVSLTNPADLMLMKNTIKQGGMLSGLDFKTLSVGFREAENYFNNATDAANVFNIALKSSVATGAEMHNTTDALAKSIKTFGGNASDADKYMRGLTKTAQISSLEMNDLTKIGGQVYGMLGSVGVGFAETNASLVTFTKYGLNATEAATQLRNEIVKLYQPAKETKRILQFYTDRTGVDLIGAFSYRGLQKNGLTGTFDKVREAARIMGMSPQELSTKLFPNNRATVAGLLMSRDDAFATFKDATNQINTSLNQTDNIIDKNFNESLDDLNTSLNRLKNTFQVIASDLATILQPALKVTADGLASFAQFTQGLPDWVKELGAKAAIAAIGFGLLATTVVRTMQAFSALKLAQATVGIGLPKVIEALNALGSTPAIGAAASSTGVLAGLTARLSSLGALLTNPWVLGTVAVVAGITGLVVAYGRLNSVTAKTTQEIINEYTARSAQADIQKKQAEHVKKLVIEITELQNKTKLSAEQSVSLKSKLAELAGISPDLVSKFSKTGEAVGLIADALARANTELKKANFDKYLAQAAPIAGRRAQLAEQRDVARTQLGILEKIQRKEPISAEELDSLYFKNRYYTVQENGGYTFAPTISQGREYENLINNSILARRGEIASLNERIKQAGAFAKNWQKTVGVKLKNGEVPPVVLGTGNNPLGVNSPNEDLEMSRIAAQISMMENKVGGLASRYKDYSEKIKFFGKSYNDSEKMAFESNLLKDPLYRSAVTKPVGTQSEVLGKLNSLFKTLSDKVVILAGQFDRLSESAKVKEKTDKARQEYDSIFADLRDRLTGREGEKQKTHLERVNEKLDSMGLYGPSQLQIMASDLDAKERGDLLSNQRRGLSALLSNKKYDENSSFAQVLRYFAANKALAEETGPLGILFTAASAQKRADDIEAMKRFASVIDGVVQDTNRKIRKGWEDIKDTIDKYNSIFANLMRNRDKAKGVFLGRINPEGSFEGWLSENYEGMTPTDKRITPERMNALREEFAYSQNNEFLGTGTRFMRSLQKKYASTLPVSANDKFSLGIFGLKTSQMNPAVLSSIIQMRELSEQLDKIETYESRVKRFGETFTSVFSRAFDAVLLKSGNFWKSLGEAGKDSLLRMASSELSRGLFDLVRATAERSGLIRKPKLTDEQKSLLNSPEFFMENLRNVLFNQGNVLAVRVVNGSTGTASGNLSGGNYGNLGNTDSGNTTTGNMSKKGKYDDAYRAIQWVGAANSIKEKNYGKAAIQIASLTKAISPEIGLALAANDVLGNPIGKAEKWFRKNILRRSTGGPAFKNQAYLFEGKPEVFVPQTNGYIVNNPSGQDEMTNGVTVNHYGDVNVNERADALRVAQAIAWKVQATRTGVPV